MLFSICIFLRCDVCQELLPILKQISVFFLAVLCLPCYAEAFSSCDKWGPLSSCSAWASHWGDFSHCGAQALWCKGSVVVAMGPNCPTVVRPQLPDQESDLCPLHCKMDSTTGPPGKSCFLLLNFKNSLYVFLVQVLYQILVLQVYFFQSGLSFCSLNSVFTEQIYLILMKANLSVLWIGFWCCI